MQPLRVSPSYFSTEAPTSTLSRRSVASEDSTLRRGKLKLQHKSDLMLKHASSEAGNYLYFHCAGSSSGIAVFLTLDKAPVAGQPIRFSVNVVNKQKVAKVLKVHLNAQAKEYNHSPSETFWETHGVIEMSPVESELTRRLNTCS